MNRSSVAPDLRAALRPNPKIPDKDFLTMSPGSVVLIVGVPCKLLNLNRGKRRLTFIFGEPEPGATDLSGMTSGSIVKIFGVHCKLGHIDPQRQRWTFTPVSPTQVMPVAEMANPVLRVTKK